MLFYSNSPKWGRSIVYKFAKYCNLQVINIEKELLFFPDDQVFVFFIPIYGEEELNLRWESFFKYYSSVEKNIGKTMVFYFFGIYDSVINLNSTIIRQIKFYTRYLSSKLFIYPNKIIKNNFSLKDMIYFYNHIPKNFFKSDFDNLIGSIIFKASSKIKENTKTTIDFTNIEDGFSCVLNKINKSELPELLMKIFDLCDREILILDRLKNVDLCTYIYPNNNIKKLYIRSSNLKKLCSFYKLVNLHTLNLSANELSVVEFESLPRKLQTLNLSKNKISNLIINDMRGIKKLSLFNNKVYKLDFLLKLPNLEYLNIGYNEGVKIFPEEILTLRRLQYLNLSYTGIKYLPIEMHDLENLKVLDVTGTNIKRFSKDVLYSLKEKEVNIIC